MDSPSENAPRNGFAQRNEAQGVRSRAVSCVCKGISSIPVEACNLCRIAHPVIVRMMSNNAGLQLQQRNKLELPVEYPANTSDAIIVIL